MNDDELRDDRFDINIRSCHNCSNLVGNDSAETSDCFRGGNDKPYAFRYSWNDFDDTQDIYLKSCPQWQPLEDD